MKQKRQIFFGPFRLDTANQQLFRGDREVDLRAKSFAVLQYLAERRKQTVSKRELLDAIWPDVYVSDGVLKVCIAEIREALGADHSKPRFIQTRHRRGYRFVASTSGTPVLCQSGFIERKRETEEMLSANIKTMRFREEWQTIVNNIVSETHDCLRAMVFDVELNKWWNSIAGQLYMITNVGLLKKGTSIKRIFILNSIDGKVRRNAILTAYVHHKLGIEVKLCGVERLREESPLRADMFSLHDNMFMAQYDLFTQPAITKIVCEGKYISECTSFYDGFFYDDKRCISITAALQRLKYDQSFFQEAENQIRFLNRIENLSLTDIIRRP